ncbi:hypothetical protein KSS87_005344 [Heliosperma pusillum]|nr:hypothetical protein KSS87_005344 [Heliosperma pusillum]
MRTRSSQLDTLFASMIKELNENVALICDLHVFAEGRKKKRGGNGKSKFWRRRGKIEGIKGIKKRRERGCENMKEKVERNKRPYYKEEKSEKAAPERKMRSTRIVGREMREVVKEE